jgi:hypothetical protein
LDSLCDVGDSFDGYGVVFLFCAYEIGRAHV